MATRIIVGTSASKNAGVVGRKTFTGGSGKFTTRSGKYKEVRAGLGMSSG